MPMPKKVIEVYRDLTAELYEEVNEASYIIEAAEVLRFIKERGFGSLESSAKVLKIALDKVRMVSFEGGRV